MKIVFALALLLILTHSFLAMAGNPPPNPDCDSKCGTRCSQAGLKERCLKYCGLCCRQCNSCVPSGTYGNKSECPCYRDLKNSKGQPKCP
ncbi:hypothetical protein MLD38_005078 [Melastoma candidum]|uniref:Uncharacterized protein n=1 Tax=Melastoma candidum TaxID=119954 RepID=A0ACB9S9A9_9MYRT|nr:hypothetical protein MLD38_005078 [Melastoma candidum]